jgi:hypothetical protein
MVSQREQTGGSQKQAGKMSQNGENEKNKAGGSCGACASEAADSDQDEDLEDESDTTLESEGGVDKTFSADKSGKNGDSAGKGM